ncbi:MAG TPA: inositol monophosphatase family protein [Candidatus Limnocylindria bacterium]|nr:inositol monophosphatase family protein [Candidatus Limnocylindria bacterium]
MLKQAEAVVRAAAQLMREGAPGAVTRKEGHANFVTEADLKVQAALEEGLTRLLPGSVVYGEEKENASIGDTPVWIVDPIDGTHNYMRGLGHSAISVALAEGRKLRLGIIFNPFRDEMFTAREGGGAFLNGHPVRCSDTPFARALSFYGTSPYNPALVRATLEAVQELMLQTSDVRRFGSGALDLAYIACGRADLFFEYSLSLWDYAAGALMVREAGGIFRLLDGDLDDLGPHGAVFASNVPCAQQALRIVASAFPA